jgi:hypothetical protein
VAAGTVGIENKIVVDLWLMHCMGLLPVYAGWLWQCCSAGETTNPGTAVVVIEGECNLCLPSLLLSRIVNCNFSRGLDCSTKSSAGISDCMNRCFETL